MQLTKQNKFILAITLQVLILAVIILFKVSVLTGGSAIYLKIRPIDPRDPLRGDYVTFRYDISRIPSYRFSTSPVNGETVYVPLDQSGKYWTVMTGVRKNKSENSKYIYLKAKVVSGGEVGGSFSRVDDFNGRNTTIQVEYGIEEYFIPEGSGRFFNFGGKEAYAKVMVDNSGNAVLKQIYIDDEPWP